MEALSAQICPQTPAAEGVAIWFSVGQPARLGIDFANSAAKRFKRCLITVRERERDGHARMALYLRSDAR
jgi:hypothetical protein